MTQASLDALEERLGHRFGDRASLERALTHASCAEGTSNERLEFLGDAVLDLVVADALFRREPTAHEGDLTRLRSRVVSDAALAAVAESLELGAALRLGGGLPRDGLSSAVLADAFEAVIGAVYRDAGFAVAGEVALRLLEDGIEDALARRSAPDWKSRLQEWTQREQITPTYELVEEMGPDHAKEFLAAVLVAGVEQGRGRGSTKKAAEQEAARSALDALRADRPEL